MSCDACYDVCQVPVSCLFNTVFIVWSINVSFVLFLLSSLFHPLFTLTLANLVRLSKSMGYTGEGRLEAWSAQSNSWQPVCGNKWDVSTMSWRACNTLGYQDVNGTWIKEETELVTANHISPRSPISPPNNRFTPMKIFFDKDKSACIQGQSQPTVYLKCDNFGNATTLFSRNCQVRQL